MQRSLPVDRHVGQRLRLARRMKGLSQTELATAVGLTFQQIQKYEKGSNRISASRLFQFAEVVGVDVPFFFRGTEQHEADAQLRLSGNDVPAPSRLDIEIMEKLAELNNPKLRQIVVDLINCLSNGAVDRGTTQTAAGIREAHAEGAALGSFLAP